MTEPGLHVGQPADGSVSAWSRPTPWWPYPRLIAHRGGGVTAPENTLAGLRAAHAAQFAAVEFDVMLAADEVAILMHDPRLGRTVPGRGRVDRLSSVQLQALDAGSWRGPEYAGEPVPTLAQALAVMNELGLWANIELKPAPGWERHTGAVVAAQVAAWWQQQPAPSGPLPLLSSFSTVALQAARDAAPELARALLLDRVPSTVLEQATRLAARAVHVRHDRLTPSRVATFHEAGLGVMAYTVNDARRAHELLDWGVDALCTDRLDAEFFAAL